MSEKDNMNHNELENEVEKNSIYNTIEKLGTICNFEEQKPFQIIKRYNRYYNCYK